MQVVNSEENYHLAAKILLGELWWDGDEFRREMLLGQSSVCWVFTVRMLLCKYDGDEQICYPYREVMLSRLRTVSETASNDLEVQTKSLNESNVSVSRVGHKFARSRLSDLDLYSQQFKGRVGRTRRLSEENALMNCLFILCALITGFSISYHVSPNSH